MRLRASVSDCIDGISEKKDLFAKPEGSNSGLR